MKKIFRLILMFGFIIAVNLIMFDILPYPHTILSLRLLNHNFINEFFNILTNIAICFFNLVMCIYVISVWRYPNKFFVKTFELFRKSWFLILILRLGLDIVIALMGTLPFAITKYLDPILITEWLFTIVMFIIVNKNTESVPKSKIKRNLDSLFLFLSLIIGFVLAIFLSIHNVNLIAKYSADLLQIYMRRFKEEIQFFCLIWNCLIWLISFLTIVGIKVFEDEQEKSEIRYLFILALRNGFLAVSILIVFGIKALIFPQGMISNINRTGSDPTIYYNKEAYELSASTIKTTISRKLSYTAADEVVWEDRFVRISYGNDKLISFHCRSTVESPESLGYIEGNVLHMTDGLVDLKLDNIIAYRYETDAVAYMDNGKPYAIRTDDINKMVENKTLTKVLKKAVSDGYYAFFEGGCQYLLKYDKDFIIQYIQRYSSDNFSEQELKNSSEYNKEYMQKFAKSLNITNP